MKKFAKTIASYCKRFFTFAPSLGAIHFTTFLILCCSDPNNILPKTLATMLRNPLTVFIKS